MVVVGIEISGRHGVTPVDPGRGPIFCAQCDARHIVPAPIGLFWAQTFLEWEALMQQNVGGIDRAVRIVAGIALLAWLIVAEGDVRWWGLLGIPLLVTGLIRRCPAYLPFHIRTGDKS